MSPTPTTVVHSTSARTEWADRRLHQRYPMTLDVEYKLLQGKRVKHEGFGRTVNISSRGILVELEGRVPSLGSIDLSIKWPFFLEGSIPLKLMVRGRIVRVDGRRIAVEFLAREFHTASVGTSKSAA